MKVFFLTALLSGLRSHSFRGVSVLGICLLISAFLASYFSPRQPMTVAMDVGFSALRIALTLLVLIWVQEFVSREIDRKTILFSLAYPVSRAEYLLGRFMGAVVLAFIAGLFLALGLWLLVFAAGFNYSQEFPVAIGFPFWLTVFGVWLDCVVVASFALLISVLSTTAEMPLATGLAFAIAGKSLGPVMDFLARGAGGDAEMAWFYGGLLSSLRYVLPDLSRLDWRAWPMYGVELPWEGIAWSSLMALGYVLIMIYLAVKVLMHRELV